MPRSGWGWLQREVPRAPRERLGVATAHFLSSVSDFILFGFGGHFSRRYKVEVFRLGARLPTLLFLQETARKWSTLTFFEGQKETPGTSSRSLADVFGGRAHPNQTRLQGKKVGCPSCNLSSGGPRKGGFGIVARVDQNQIPEVYRRKPRV